MSTMERDTDREQADPQYAQSPDSQQPGDPYQEATASIVHDPDAFRLRGDPPRVMRLSRKALASLAALACLAIGAALVYALQPARHNAGRNLIDTENRNRASSITGAPADYTQVPKLGQPLPGDLGAPILSAQQRGQSAPMPAMGGTGLDPRIAEGEMARQRALQERDSARISRLFLGGTGNAGQNDSGEPRTQSAGDTAPTPASINADQRGARDVGADKTFVSDQRIVAPASSHILQAGSIIPAALLTGIQSDLPGQITAQVTQNVFDSPTGRILLIPQGSRLIGGYDSEIDAGQNRVQLSWNRLILPGGGSILLDRQPGADSAGMAGLRDGVNYHWGHMLKAALISTLLGVGSELATGSDDDLVRALRYGTQDTVSQTGRQVVQRQLNVPPTLTIRPGHVLRVIVTRDLLLEPVGQDAMP